MMEELPQDQTMNIIIEIDRYNNPIIQTIDVNKKSCWKYCFDVIYDYCCVPCDRICNYCDNIFSCICDPITNYFCLPIGRCCIKVCECDFACSNFIMNKCWNGCEFVWCCKCFKNNNIKTTNIVPI